MTIALAPVALAPPSAPSAPAPTQHARLRVQVAAGGLLAADGTGARHDNYGIAARAALLLGRWEVGLRASFGLAERLATAPARVELSQHRCAAYGGYAFLDEPAYRVTALAAVGSNAYVSRVHARVDGFEAASARGVLSTFALGAQSSWLPAFTRRRVGLAASILAELYPERLQLSYRASGAAVHVARAWRAQPVLTLELVVPLLR